jgi:hypothetical protein
MMIMDDDEEVVAGRKLLRAHANVQMWQEYVDGPHPDTGQLLRYFVGRAAEQPKAFAAPGQAFAHFQQLSGAPTSPR